MKKEGREMKYMRAVRIPHPLRGEEGFTLVELLAVMAILVLLAVLAVPRVAGVLAESKEKACVANRALFEDAANLYATAEDAPQQLTAQNVVATLTSAGYLKEGVFKCPVDGDTYEIAWDAAKGYLVTCGNGCGTQ
jgi:prepilin-type N-terminal cleavage/methylation domain-containing protein